MNRKAVFSFLADSFAYIIFVLLIVAFVFLFNLKSDSIGQDGNTIQGRIDDTILKNQELVAILNTPISSCNVDLTQLGISERSDIAREMQNPQLTYASALEIAVTTIDGRINLATLEELLQAEPQSNVKGIMGGVGEEYLKVWYVCTKKHLMHPGTRERTTTEKIASSRFFAGADLREDRVNDIVVEYKGKTVIAPENFGGGYASQYWQDPKGNEIALRLVEPPWQFNLAR